MKNAIVTGAAGNLGQAVVKKFLHEGYKVVGTVHRETSAVEANSRYRQVVIDLGDEDKVSRFVKSITEELGSLDAVVLTVGGFAMGNLENTSSVDLGKQYKLNFETAYHVARPVFLKMMEQGSGRIFFIGSRPGLEVKSGKSMVAYSLAKSLLFRLAELMNEEAGKSDVVVSVVVPSTIDTPDNRTSMPGADFNKWVTPEAIADVIHFYCSGEGRVLREPVLKVFGKG